ncbi:hypothetical protein S40293_04816 [Stachybotrys chartarum IBT 40293]|nr:hypothetical protein S40293_04816 [Stachybotrys chartarum IBT 40293]KFA74392.1 hypothetical protein S40288_03967 [Stachybotrys chartarum IBT 40288]
MPLWHPDIIRQQKFVLWLDTIEEVQQNIPGDHDEDRPLGSGVNQARRRHKKLAGPRSFRPLQLSAPFAMQLLDALFVSALLGEACAATCIPRGDPFRVVDPQEWVNPDDMVWEDWRIPPGTNWSDPSRTGAERNFNIALVTLDYEDRPFSITQPPGSTIYGNPQPAAANIPREDVPVFYRDLLNTPNELNRGHTLHEYWMEDSAGRFGVDLTVFGAYRMPSLAWQYGIDNSMNSGSCPAAGLCNRNIRTDGLNLWRSDVGNATADSFELVFILSAGQDESGVWQEFGVMRWSNPEDVPDEFGPPAELGPDLPNWATTRYVPWTSWAAASTIWPNAGGGSSTQAESSGMGVFAHELSHLLRIGDNYNNPYGVPLRRSYTGPWSMMSRGSFNGPGGPHTRWQIPSLQGSSLGSAHTVRDKYQLGLMDDSELLWLSRAALAESGIVIARLTARTVESSLKGLRVELEGGDLTPACNVNTDVFCDGGGYNYYDLEVVDRIGADSFQPDSGVMISKSKQLDRLPFQWMIDANPQDIRLVDFVAPNGTTQYITLGDYRQLADALFHAGTRSGSEFEHVDEANGLHFYVVSIRRDDDGVLSYNIGVRSLNGTGASTFGIDLAAGNPVGSTVNTPTTTGVFCSFDLTNNGTYVAGGDHPSDVSGHSGYDIYRLEAAVAGAGWLVEIPNALVMAEFGATVSANVAVRVGADEAAELGVVTLTATSESDSSVSMTAQCSVPRD